MNFRTGLWLAAPAIGGLALGCSSNKRQAERIVYAFVQQDPPTTQPAAQPSTQPPGDDDVERARQEALRELQGGASTQPATQAASDIAPLPSRPFANFNPDITVYLDAIGTWSPNRENDFYNRFDVREAEVDFRAAVHPRADGVLILAIERDVHNELWGHEEGDEEEEEFETTIDIEEGYLFIHDTGVPNLTAKLGRFHLRFSHEEKDLYQVCDRVLVLWPSQAPGEPSEAILVPKANLSLALGRPPGWEGEP